MITMLLFIIIGLVAGICRALAGQKRIVREAGDAITRARSRGVVHGLNMGWIHHGRALAQIRRIPVHGFAAECGGCQTLFGIIAETDEEYWKCSSCGHRNPAPLVAEDPCKLIVSTIRQS